MWQYVGFYFVIFLTGMSKISPDIYESAELDGIRPWQKAVYITIPMMRDVLASAVVLVISGCFKVFDMVYVITNGGPMNSSQLLSTYMYSMAFEKYNGGRLCGQPATGRTASRVLCWLPVIQDRQLMMIFR